MDIFLEVYGDELFLEVYGDELMVERNITHGKNEVGI